MATPVGSEQLLRLRSLGLAIYLALVVLVVVALAMGTGASWAATASIVSAVGAMRMQVDFYDHEPAQP